MSPGQVHAAAAGDPFQRWDLAQAAQEGAAAGEIRQQRWQQYELSEQQWQQQVIPLRRQQQQQPPQQKAFAGAACHDAGSKLQQQQWGLLKVHVLQAQQHSEQQQQLLLLPPSKAALMAGRSRRCSRLLLCVDDLAAGHCAAAGMFSRGRCLSQVRATWSSADKEVLSQLQEQQQSSAAVGGMSTGSVKEVGALLPPLLLSAAARLRQFAPVLRSVWGALIPAVLSPPAAIMCSSSGLTAQIAAEIAAPW
jgi:hypothetical protein